MKYISLAVWRDLEDGHLYREGEPFPFDGRDVEEERLDELENGRNRAGLRLIAAEKVRDEEIPVPREEAPKTRAKTTKTTAKTVKKK